MSNEKWGVFKQGGSCGESSNCFIFEDMTESEAKDKAKRFNSYRSEGEKKYYKIRYSAKKMK